MSNKLDMGAVVAHEEKRSWIMVVVAVLSYATYLAIVLGRAANGPLAAVDYRSALLWCVGGSIVVSIVLSIAVSIASPRDAGKKDQRDREIGRFGDTVGQSFLVIGAVAGLILALAEANHFWIANAIYLGFTLSAVLGSVAKLFAYRKGFHPW
jgi:hypothetical protein